eukprot:7412981-Prorocentrum_lima.AAC.1
MGHASSQDRRQYAPFVWRFVTYLPSVKPLAHSCVTTKLRCRKVEILNATAAESEIAGAAPKGLEEVRH